MNTSDDDDAKLLQKSYKQLSSEDLTPAIDTVHHAYYTGRIHHVPAMKPLHDTPVLTIDVTEGT